MLTINKHIRSFISIVHPSNWKSQYDEIKSIVTNEQMVAFRENYLKYLLLHTFVNVPYYHHILSEIGIIKNGEVDISQFSRIPILTKEIIRKNRGDLVSKDKMKRKSYSNSSGGSVGEPIRIIQDEIYTKWGQAASHYYYNDILGINLLHAKKVILWGSVKDFFKGGAGLKAKFIKWLNNTIFLNSYKMTENDLFNYVKLINSYKPEFIRGYAGSLYELCQYTEKVGLKLHSPRIVVSSAEMLSDDRREKIEKVFGSKVYDFYGAREVNSLAGECENGLMHIFDFNNYIEVLDHSNQQVMEGDQGRVIVTNLHNYSMPLIRYEIGDLAVLGPLSCQCGIPLPTLKKVTGRTVENFVMKDGTLISGAALTLTFHLKEWVKSFQIVQQDYKRIKIYIVLQGVANVEDQKEIDGKIKSLLGQDCEIIWDFVSEIPKTPQGKYLYIKSLVPR